MKEIAFFNVKGGVGKTTSAINIAYILAQEKGKKVLLADFDPQGNSTDFFDDDQHTRFTADNISNIFSDTCNSIETAIYPTKYSGLDILPSVITLSRAEKAMLKDDKNPQQYKFRDALASVEKKYDYLIMDLSPGAETLINMNALAIAQAVFIPLRADKWTMAGLNYTMEIITSTKKFNYKLSNFFAFFTQWENRRVNKAAYETVQGYIGNHLLDITICKSKNADEITYVKQPFSLYDKRSKVAAAYQALTEKVLLI